MPCLLCHGGLRQFVVRNHTQNTNYFRLLSRICVSTLKSAACFAEPIEFFLKYGPVLGKPARLTRLAQLTEMVGVVDRAHCVACGVWKWRKCRWAGMWGFARICDSA